MIIDELANLPLPVQSTDELPIERGELAYKVTYNNLVGSEIAGVKSNITTLQGNVTTLQNTDSKIESSIAIIVNGNTTSTTIAEGQYVYIKGSTILSEGLYTANSAVPSGTTVASTYFTAVSGGGLNAIQQSLATFKPGDNYFEKIFAIGYTTGSGNYFGFFIPGDASKITSVTSVTCLDGSTCMKASGGRIDIDGTLNIASESISPAGICLEARFASTQSINMLICVILVGVRITCT